MARASPWSLHSLRGCPGPKLGEAATFPLCSSMAKVCPPECLQIVLSGCCLLRIEEDTVANDPRVLAHVSCEEARTYIRGVNAHHAEGTKKIRMQMRGCFACMLLGVVLYGVGLGVWVEEKRLRCEGRPCGLGEDPLVDKCCIFWCCGNEMRTSPVRARRLRAPPKKKKKKKGGPAAHPDGHKLKTRPDDHWDVWANETYFGITERCSLYDEKPPDDHTKRDAKYDCTSCPASLLDEEDENKVGCRTMFEGKATEHEVWWPFLFIAVWALPIVVLVRLLCALKSANHRLYAEAFEDWRARGVVSHVEFQGAVHRKHGKDTPNYLRLYFPAGQAVEPVITGTVVHAAAVLRKQ